MSDRIAIFRPGDYRAAPNTMAEPYVEQANRQLEAALDRLGRKHFRVEGFITRPDEARAKLRIIDDPMIGLYTHWVYAPHTVDGLIGKSNPLLMASNFSGRFPGLVGLLNTGASLQAEGRQHSRMWTDAEGWAADHRILERLEEWLRTGKLVTDDRAVRPAPAPSAPAQARAAVVHQAMAVNMPLLLMLGDTSMGMTNGYFGARTLHKVGFLEHKVDQAWIIDYGLRVSEARINDAFAFVQDRGVSFHWGAAGAEDFTPAATREQLRDYLAVLDLAREFKADCIGWQYQLGMIHRRPPSDFAEGLFNSTCRPEGDGDTIVDATEADQGNALPMEMMKRLLKAKGLHQSVAFHDVRWGLAHEGRFVWVLLNSGSAGAYAFNHDPQSLAGVHSHRQPAQYFPTPGGSFAGESLPGPITWARAWLDNGEPVMDIGRGEVVRLPKAQLEAVWRGTTPEWPIMIADLRLSRDGLMQHYMSNHIAVAYGDIFEEMAALSELMGFRVRWLEDAAS
ncbi:MAG: fucose isomerase [Alphaproteobacteria bacterium]|nr:fucose isomerase [Alphaproteobacteria bacterium]